MQGSPRGENTGNMDGRVVSKADADKQCTSAGGGRRYIKNGELPKNTSRMESGGAEKSRILTQG